MIPEIALENEGGPKTEAPGQKQIPQELLTKLFLSKQCCPFFHSSLWSVLSVTRDNPETTLHTVYILYDHCETETVMRKFANPPFPLFPCTFSIFMKIVHVC